MGTPVDLLLSARRIYTVDGSFSTAECMVVRKGRVVALGMRDEMEVAFTAQRRLDLGEAYVYPGFMDPHCHFLSYGYVLQRARLFGARSWEETIARLVEHRAQGAIGWVQGRGWDQNGWAASQFPDNRLLDKAFPVDPVLAIRVDGHAAMANSAALAAAGIDASTKVDGGTIVISGGRPTGLLLDNAVDLVKKAIPAPDATTRRQALLAAQQNCLAAGLTSVSNAGTEKSEALLMATMQGEGILPIRIYVMLAPTQENIERFAAHGPLVNEGMSIRSFKMFADGALGSRGARLLEPYADDPGNRGLFTLDPVELDRVCSIARACGFQMNVHAIGDAATRLVLDAYEKHLKTGNDLRWRIEHAQIVHDDDLSRFGYLGVIPSIQTTHATSDMGWTETRLGPERIGRAHRYRDLLAENAWLANGSDFPIERIEPLRGFISATLRKDDEGRPQGGYRMGQALSRAEALHAMTLWAARANFEEGTRGSLEPGKWADFTVLDTDLIDSDEEALLGVRVLATGIAGEILFDLNR
jgi:predicted amidohydrolase YtcJ